MRPVGRAAAAQPPREDDRQRGLVELLSGPLLRAVDERVLPERSVGLLHLPQVVEQPARAGAVARRLLRGGHVVEVTRPDEVVRAGPVAAVLELQRAPDPRHRRRRDRGAAVALVLGRGEHEQRLPVELAQLRVTAHRRRRLLEGAQVGGPAERVARPRAGERTAERVRGGGACGALRGSEADGQRHRPVAAPAGERRAGGLHHVAGRRRVGPRVQVPVLQIGPRVARRAGVAAGRPREGGPCGHGRGDRVVMRNELARGADPHVVVAVVARRGVDEREHLQGPAGERRRAHAGEHRRARRVGDPGLLQHPA